MAASPALAPPPGNPRFPLMDSLRGLATLAVVLAHAYGAVVTQRSVHHHIWDGLALGFQVVVPVFCGLSGFLLIRPYLAAHARGESGPRLLEFWRRRVLRIVPAYWVALTIIALTLPTAAIGVFGDHWWLFYGFGQAYSPAHIHDGIPVAWTLTSEATFYVSVPLFAMAMRRIGPWPVIVGLLSVGIALRVTRSIGIDNPPAPLLEGLLSGFPGFAPYFAVGMAAAVWSVEGVPSVVRPLVARPGVAWIIAGALYLCVSTWLSILDPVGPLGYRFRYLGFYAVCGVVVLLLLLPTAFERPGRVRRWLSRPGLVFCGVVSYGLYLWHDALTEHLQRHGLLALPVSWGLVPRVGIAFIIIATGSLLTATISYYVVELPFLRLKEKRLKAPLIAPPSDRAGAVAGGVPRS